MKKTLAITLSIAGLLVIAVFTSFYLKREKPVNNTNDSIAKSNQAISEEKKTNLSPDLVIGSPNAKVEIIEYADFKCPTCNKFHQNAGKEIRQKYVDSGKVKIVFRNLPFIAPDSRVAAEGAYCANAQNKFVDYHDLLFNHINNEYYSKGRISEGEEQEVFSKNNLAKMVKTIGIDDVKFSSCLSSGTFSAAVQSDLDQSRKDEATGTPTFVVANQKIVGAQSFSFFEKLINIGLSE